jgi:agmatinase
MTSVMNPGAFGALDDGFCHYDTAAVAVLPIPYDGTSTWMKGADLGPQAVIDASAHMELYDIETGTEVFRRGIVTLAPVDCPENPEQMAAAVHKRACTLLRDRKFVVGVGGEHSVSVGLVRAAAERFTDLSVLQLDAHCDTRESYEGSRFNHACVMARIGEICPYVQAGIRSMDVSECAGLKRERTFFAHEIVAGKMVAPRMLKALTQHVYITIDLDVLDPSIMPSTGTPEPGGLDWYTLFNLLRPVIAEKNVVGMDVTELLPNPRNKAPDFLAAKLIYRVLSMIFA